MNWRSIRAVIRKDLRQVFQNRMVWLPMILVPLIIQILMPIGLVLLPRFTDAMDSDQSDLGQLVAALPQALQGPLQGLSGGEQWVILVANYMFTPMFLIVPLMVSSILGSDSFAGEKERKTLEALFYTPMEDRELFLAKVLTALMPAVTISIVTFILYGILVNLAGYGIVGRIYFPAPVWWPMVFWLGPAISLAGLGATVLISSRSRSFVQTQQISGVLVLPIVFLMIAQFTGSFFLSPSLAVLIGGIVWVVGACLVWIGAKTFSRDALITSI